MSSKRILVLFLIFAAATAALFMSCANPSSGPSEYDQKKHTLMTEIYRDTVGTVDKTGNQWQQCSTHLASSSW